MNEFDKMAWEWRDVIKKWADDWSDMKISDDIVKWAYIKYAREHYKESDIKIIDRYDKWFQGNLEPPADISEFQMKEINGYKELATDDWYSDENIKRRQSRALVINSARRDMEKLGTDILGEDGISEEVKKQVIKFLEEISINRLPLVSIAPVYEGAALHWVAGDLSMMIDIADYGPDCLWISEGNKQHTYLRIEDIYFHSLKMLIKIADVIDQSNG